MSYRVSALCFFESRTKFISELWMRAVFYYNFRALKCGQRAKVRGALLCDYYVDVVLRMIDVRYLRNYA